MESQCYFGVIKLVEQQEIIAMSLKAKVVFQPLVRVSSLEDFMV